MFRSLLGPGKIEVVSSWGGGGGGGGRSHHGELSLEVIVHYSLQLISGLLAV